jgi:hypothetical protein
MKNLIHTAVVTLFAASAAHAQQAVQWKVSDGGNGHWYSQTAFGAFDSWTAATEYATSSGAHLATIVDQMEQEFVVSVSTVGTCEAWGGMIWLGAQQMPGLPADQGWSWSTNEPWKFTNWSQGEPNDYDGWAEDRLCMYAATGRWNDGTDFVSTFSCNFAAMLEWSADCNSDGIVDYGQCHDGTLADYNGNNIPDCCDRGDACVVGNYPVQWRIEDGGNGHWYQVRAKVGDWFACRAAAQGLTGDLASPSTAIENSFVERLVPPKQFPIWNRVFLGGRQNNGSAPNEGWYWVDGSAWNYVDWFENQPNGGEGFLVTMPDESGCTWGDYPSNSSDIYYFMVEWSADCNSDGIVDYGQILQGQLADTNADGIPDICQQPTCVDADIYRDFNVNGADLGILLSQWGPNTPLTESDLYKDGLVNGADLGIMLSFWGACP